MRNKKKILVINTIPSKTDNGVYSVLYNYAKCTCNLYDYDFALAGYAESKAINQLKQVGKEVFLFKKYRVKAPISYILWLKKILQKKRYDIVHVHGNSGTMFLEMAVAKKQGVHVRVSHCHSTSCKYKIAHYILKYPLNCLITTAVACSKEAGMWLYNREFVVLSNGINSDCFTFNNDSRLKLRSELCIDDCFVIGHVGHLSAEKNHRFLVEIAQLLKEKIRNFKILLVGEGSLRDDLEKQIKSNSLEDYFLFLGRRTDVAELYSAMDMFVFPSLYEGFGLVLLEAQANGLSCIASSHVPKATQMSNNILYLSLQNKERWVNEINNTFLSQEEISRVEASNKNILKIKKKGYDVASNQSKLIEIYRGIV